MFKIKILPLPRNPINDLSDKRSVFRVSSLLYLFYGRLSSLVVFIYSKGFLGPGNLSAANIPAKTARVAQSLCFGQIDLTSPQGIFGEFAIGPLLAFT